MWIYVYLQNITGFLECIYGLTCKIGWIYSNSPPRERNNVYRGDDDDFGDAYERESQVPRRNSRRNSFQPFSFISSGISSITDYFSGSNNGMPRRKPSTTAVQRNQKLFNSIGLLRYWHSFSASRRNRFHQLRRGRLINPWTPFWKFLKFDSRRSSSREYLFDGYGG